MTNEGDDDYKRADGKSDAIEKKFNYDFWWFWIISFVVEIGVLTAYFLTDGNELYFIFWIPTDFILFVCMFIYYLMVAY